MKKHHHQKTRRCAHCGQRFTVNPRVGQRHRYCARPACAQACLLRARKRWLRKNGGKQYYHRSDNTDRVRAWRRQNPGYWRRKKAVRRRGRNEYVLTKQLAAALKFAALQEAIDTHLALKIGVISHLAGSALQEAIAKKIRQLMLRGHAILRGKIPKE